MTCKCFYQKDTVVGVLGNPKASLVFVVEAPQPMEFVKRVPITGINEQVLRSALPKDFDDFYVVSAIGCLPIKHKTAQKQRSNIQCASQACSGRLKELISEHPRKLIVAMGNAALWGLTGNLEMSAMDERGRLFESGLAEIGIIVSASPTTISAGGSSLGKFHMDVGYALDLYNGGDIKEPGVVNYHQIRTDAKFKEIIDHYFEDDYEYLGADIETTGFDHRGNAILELGFGVGNGIVHTIADDVIDDIDLTYLDFDLSFQDGGPFRWVWQNGKFDVKFLNRLGLRSKVDEDVMLMSYTLDERAGFHSLEHIAKDFLGAPDHKHMVKPYLKNKQSSYADIPREVLRPYLMFDVHYTLESFFKLKPLIEACPKNNRLYREVLLPASELLRKIELKGMYVNFDQVRENEELLSERVIKLREKLFQISKDNGGGEFNPNSPAQVANFIYKVLQLGKGGNTLEETLLRLPHHEGIDTLLEYRGDAKALSTYIKPLHDHAGTDGRVHATYKLHGTVTGRLASSDPNMQNIPRDRHMRNMFQAKPGNILVAIDLDQAELRCLGALSKDEALCRIYLEEGLSLHKEVSVTMWGEDWTENYALDDTKHPLFVQAKEQYMRTKAINFGIIYGRTAATIAREFKIPTSEAQLLLDMWAERFPDAWAYIQKCRMAPLRRQTLVTPFGRRKRYTIGDMGKMYNLQNEAANFPHQSIASDITLTAAATMANTLKAKWNADIVNVVHDENVIEMINDMEKAKEMARYAVSIMEQTPIRFGIDHIPFSADAKMGLTWGDLKDVNLN